MRRGNIYDARGCGFDKSNPYKVRMDIKKLDIKEIKDRFKFEKIYEKSLTIVDNTTLFLVRKNGEKLLVVSAGKEENRSIVDKFSGEDNTYHDLPIKLCKLTSENACSLRKICPFTKPITAGNKTAFGFGDRLGNATPGHIRAVSKFKVFPVFAQQSIREMTRTGRSPQKVMDSASWGVFQLHYTAGFGADADHLKTRKDIEFTVRAGFTMFTVDSSDHITDKAASMPAIEHMIEMYNYLAELKCGEPFDFEVSIDETDLPTSVKDHLFIITRLTAHGVRITSLAPKFVGEFQKAIDYIGDVENFARELEKHAAISRKYGNYKISIHSGSDKFSIFPAVGKITRGLFHEKTAGTSYLEAIRVIAMKVPSFYRQIHKFALTRFEQDRVSYHVTTNLKSIPDVDEIPDENLEKLFDDNDTRQLIHITYGSILQAKDKDGKYIFRDKLTKILDENEEDYFELLDRHLSKHMSAFGLETNNYL